MEERMLEALEAREELEYLMKKRRRRKKILAFVLAVTILVTFAIPISMMIPIREPEQRPENAPPLYSMNTAINNRGDVNV